MYKLALASYIFAMYHFYSEWLIYGTNKANAFPSISPLIVSGASRSPWHRQDFQADAGTSLRFVRQWHRLPGCWRNGHTTSHRGGPFVKTLVYAS